MKRALLSKQSSSEEEEEEKHGQKHTWSRILNKAMNRHSTQLDELVQEYERSGDSQEIAACIQKRVKENFVRIFNMDARFQARPHLQRNNGHKTSYNMMTLRVSTGKRLWK